MSQTASNVAAHSPVASGGVSWAPFGTALPTDATTSPDSGFVPLGYVGVDGVSDGSDAAGVEDIFAWGGDNVATLETTGSVKRYAFKLIEMFSADVAKFIYGEDNVTVTAATDTEGEKIAILDKAGSIPPGILLLDMRYGGKRKRIVCANASAQVTGADPFVHTAVGGDEVTVTCKKDAADNRQYIYLENDVLDEA